MTVPAQDFAQRSSRRASRARWTIPAPIKFFILRRSREALGFVLAGLGLFLALALLTYSQSDQSLNHATEIPPTNMMGAYGAIAADFVLQFFATTSVLLPVFFLAWGSYLFRHRGIGHKRWRILALPVALVLLAVMLGLVALDPVLAPWQPVGVGGGVVGDLLAMSLATTLISIGVPLWGGVILCSICAFVLVAFCMPVTRQQWSGGVIVGATAIGRGTSRIAGRVFQLFGFGLRSSANLMSSSIAKSRTKIPPRAESGEDDRPAATPKKAKPARRSAKALDTKRVAKKEPKLKVGRREKEARQKNLDLPVPSGTKGGHHLPPIDLLTPATRSGAAEEIDREALEQNARMLESVLDDFGVRGDIVQVRPGPVVTMYELEPAPGTKTSRVISLADDIARSMSAVSVRIAVVPGRNAIGIELPNAVREMVSLSELLASEKFEKSKGLPLALGKNIAGEPVFADLSRMPHVLIAGTTGSGKSVGVNAMIISLLYRFTPAECRFIMVDPKMLELSIYDGIPHLLAPVVTDPKKAVVALKWVVREMETRYQSMSKLGVRNIDGYNQTLAQARKSGEILSRKVQTGFDGDTGKPVYEEQPLDMNALPRIVVIVDEMADLMLVAGKDVEAAIQRLAQMARAAGIHLVMATQRPSVDVVTGTIKANFPTRIGFQVTSKIDSRTILGEQGAEQLLGQGDMLYMAGGGRITRVHGGFVSDDEVTDVTAFLRDQGVPDYDDAITSDENIAEGIPGFDPSGSDDGAKSSDTLYDQAVALVAREGKASTSFVQRHLQIGYNRAARIIEQMEKEGVVSQANHVGKREVLVSDQSEPEY